MLWRKRQSLQVQSWQQALQFQRFGLLPGKLVSTEMSVGCSSLVDWLLQFEVPVIHNSNPLETDFKLLQIHRNKMVLVQAFNPQTHKLMLIKLCLWITNMTHTRLDTQLCEQFASALR